MTELNVTPVLYSTNNTERTSTENGHFVGIGYTSADTFYLH